MKRIGRNDLCPCESGKKSKHCCFQLDKVQAAEGHSIRTLLHEQFQFALEQHQAGHLSQAESIYRGILQTEPNHPEALHFLGVIAHQVGKSEFAVELISKAISISSSSQMYCNLGAAFYTQGKLDAAVESYYKALSTSPDFADAYHNLGTALREQGKTDEAIACYRRALTLKPDHAAAHHSLIFTMHRLEPENGAAIFAQTRLFAEQFEKGTVQLTHRNAPYPDRKLKVGYVSGDFREHPVSYFIEPVLANHDDYAVEVYCYSNHSLTDHVTKRLMKYPKHWRLIAGLTDDRVAELVQQDGIDILVDLSGHTQYHRLLTFVRKPAPVQVTWIGMPITTGLSAMDYRLTNKHIDPDGMNDQYHSEILVRLSSSACFQPEADLPAVNSLPALTNGYVTFSSFNDTSKITPAVFALWARILAMLPDSRLMMICPEYARGQINHEFMAHGIGSDRLILINKLPLLDYLAMHNNVDIALDPFPCNGGTITRNSLWMGVPVATLAGNRPITRVGLMLMSQVGLEAFIAENEEAYVQIALRWAHDLDGLSRIRNELRQRVQDAPFSNAEGYTREIETAYRQMWRIWCARQDACCDA